MIITDRFTLPAKTVTATTTIGVDDCIIICNNAATNITTALPPIATLNDGHRVGVGRGTTSTGTITISLGAGATAVQAQNGASAITTTISAHNAAGAGLITWFTLIGTVWYREK